MPPQLKAGIERSACGRLFDLFYNAVLYSALIFWLFIIVKSSYDNKSIKLRGEAIHSAESISQSMYLTTTKSPASSVYSIEKSVPAVLVVLGNEPLDDNTPTVDTMKRVEVAVDYYKKHPSSILIFTGGPTAGKTTEAQMMAKYAVSLGVSMNDIKLEEKARSTGENAIYVANILLNENIKPKVIFIVSKQDHLQWAMPMFKGKRTPGHVFQDAQPLGISVDRQESIAQMEKYLETHNSKRVRMRMENLQKGIQGID